GESEPSAPISSWSTNQYPSITYAGSTTVVMKKPSVSSVCTRTRGYRRMYAPMTPLIAPEAPTIGATECGWMNTCAAAAATPQIRENTTNRAWPIESSMLFPNTHRNHMLPSWWNQPPCMNIEVRTAPQCGAFDTTRSQ